MIPDDSLPTTATSTDGTASRDRCTEPMDRRERVLEYLKSGPGVATIDELVTVLSPAADDPDAARRYRIRLHHADLPRLEDAGEIVYEPTSHHAILLE